MSHDDLCSAPIISVGREEVILDSANSKSTSKGKKSHGFHLVRSKWDPYPWIGSVESESSAKTSGLRSGDCLLDIDGQDVLGLELKDIALLIGKNERVSLGIWRRPSKSNPETANDVDCSREKDESGSSDPRHDGTGTLLEGPLPEVAQKLVRAVSGVVKALECPVCLESAAPPVSQCVHGHLLCFGCRLKTERCPVCRVRLGRGRCLLADKSHRALAEALVDAPLNDSVARSRSLRDTIFGPNANSRNNSNNNNNSSSSSSNKPPSFAQRARSPMRQLLSRMLSSSNQRFSGLRSDEPDSEEPSRNGSTESLPSAMTGCPMVDGNLLYGRRWLLRLYDRRKSASTGELSKPRDDEARERRLDELRLRDQQSDAATDHSGSLLSVPQTPNWGGSTESMTAMSSSAANLCCPLRERVGCRMLLDFSHDLLEHLSKSHTHAGPLIHFYTNSVRVSLPLPLADGIYLVHHMNEIFVIENNENKVWIGHTNTNKYVNWEWTLDGMTKSNETVVSTRKDVASLREPFTLTSDHVATLPDGFSSLSVIITLIAINDNEKMIHI